MPANDSYKILVNGFVFYFTKTDLDTLDLAATSPTEFNAINRPPIGKCPTALTPTCLTKHLPLKPAAKLLK